MLYFQKYQSIKNISNKCIANLTPIYTKHTTLKTVSHISHHSYVLQIAFYLTSSSVSCAVTETR